MNPIVFNTCEMRLCNAAQNEAHIKSDDYRYDESCTVGTFCATRMIHCLSMDHSEMFTAGQTPNIHFVSYKANPPPR